MSEKRKYSFWELNFGVGLLGLLAAPILGVGIYVYENFIKLDPIDKAYCYCINSEGRNIRAKLDYYPRDAKETLYKLENGEPLYRESDLITKGAEIWVLKYSDDSVFVNVRWSRMGVSGIIEDDGWVPRVCLHDSPPE